MNRIKPQLRHGSWTNRLTALVEKRPSISVLLTVYNGARYIREAIESILAQTFADFEFLVIDDGSTDNSADIVAAYTDPRIILIRLEHGGLVAALNAGLKRTCGGFIARMDADDRARPTRLAVQHAYLESHPDVDIVCSDVATIDAEGRISGEQVQSWVDNNLLRDGLLYRRTIKPVIHPTVMMRREVIQALGGYRAFETCEDHDLWLRAIDRFRFHRINEVLLDYRIYEGGISRTRGVKQATHSSMSAITYLVRKGTGIDIFDERPEIFEELTDQVRRTIETGVNVPASVFRDARLKMLTGRPMAGMWSLLYGFSRFGTTLLPYRTTMRMREEIERFVALARIKLAAETQENKKNLEQSDGRSKIDL